MLFLLAQNSVWSPLLFLSLFFILSLKKLLSSFFFLLSFLFYTYKFNFTYKTIFTYRFMFKIHNMCTMYCTVQTQISGKRKNKLIYTIRYFISIKFYIFMFFFSPFSPFYFIIQFVFLFILYSTH